jgi:hypothetical protein
LVSRVVDGEAERAEPRGWKVLLAKAEAYVKSRGGKRVRMTVLAVRETLINWYQRRGYLETGVTEAFPYGDERFGKPLLDDLYFVVLEKGLEELTHNVLTKS